MEEQRICKGIFVPIEIWQDKNLGWNEKILFIEIDSFTSKTKDCFISDEYIASYLGISVTNANKTLNSLIKKGYVTKTRFDGRKRYVRTAFSYNNHVQSSSDNNDSGDTSRLSEQGCQKDQACIDDNDNIPNTKIPKSDLPKTNTKKEVDDKSSTKKKKKRDVVNDFDFRQALLEAGADSCDVDEWMRIRKKNKNSRYAYGKFLDEVKDAGISIKEAVSFSCENGWQGFKAEWYKNRNNNNNYGYEKRGIGRHPDVIFEPTDNNEHGTEKRPF